MREPDGRTALLRGATDEQGTSLRAERGGEPREGGATPLLWRVVVGGADRAVCVCMPIRRTAK